MEKTKERIKLDEILKMLFSTSNKVLVKLLNGIFDEDFSEDEVEVYVTNNELVKSSFDVIRGDRFFKLYNKLGTNLEKHNMNYHIEFQTTNDKTMVVRMFEYAFKKGYFLRGK